MRGGKAMRGGGSGNCCRVMNRRVCRAHMHARVRVRVCEGGREWEEGARGCTLRAGGWVSLRGRERTE